MRILTLIAEKPVLSVTKLIFSTFEQMFNSQTTPFEGRFNVLVL